MRYKDPTGSYRAKMFDRKKEADRYKLQIETELANGDHVAPRQSRTLADAVKLFLEDIDSKVAIGAMRPCTAKNYHSAFRQAILPAMGHRLMLEIDSADLEHWYHDVVRSKRMEGVSALRRLWFVKALFDFAARRKWVRKGINPASEAMEAIGRPRENKIETFDLATVRKVIACANERRFNGQQAAFEMTRLAVNLAAFCGLRWGEIFGLTLANVNLRDRTIRIRHSLDGFGNLQEPKTKAGNRDVPLPQHIAAMLAEYIVRHPSNHPEGIVFTTKGGGHYRASNFRQYAWLPLQSRAGVIADRGRSLRFHALRHFAVSWMIENGWPITDVSAIVGQPRR